MKVRYNFGFSFRKPTRLCTPLVHKKLVRPQTKRKPRVTVEPNSQTSSSCDDMKNKNLDSTKKVGALSTNRGSLAKKPENLLKVKTKLSSKNVREELEATDGNNSLESMDFNNGNYNVKLSGVVDKLQDHSWYNMINFQLKI